MKSLLENPKEDSWTFEKVSALFPTLKEIQNRKRGYLSRGEQQMLAVARTLIGNPDLLLPDEPSEGLTPLIARESQNQIIKLRDEGETILLAEQTSNFV